ncbi:MAG: hypothetical protein GAK40_00622 [Burkholderia plantarii]|nr:MAG: hypothetical protein GAK40_00622 [Burkholderia plantarii]
MFKAVIAIIIGIGFLVAAAWTAVLTNDFIHAATIVPGTVVKLNAGGSHPEIAFVTTAGERVSYAQGGWIWGMKVGDAVRVRYLPEAPSITARLDRIGATWASTLFLLWMGVGFAGVGWMNWPSRDAHKPASRRRHAE